MTASLRDAMQLALEALEDAGWTPERDKAIAALRASLAVPEAEPVVPKDNQLQSIIAGALFDLMGFLTSRDERITLSGRDEAGPAVEALQAWAKTRSLELGEANVTGWQACVAQPAPMEPLHYCRNELVTAIHCLASHYENAFGVFGADYEARLKAKGDIAHALDVAEKWNWNGQAPQSAPVEPAKPLTDEQIKDAFGEFAIDAIGFANARRIAHGIQGVTE